MAEPVVGQAAAEAPGGSAHRHRQRVHLYLPPAYRFFLRVRPADSLAFTSRYSSMLQTG